MVRLTAQWMLESVEVVGYEMIKLRLLVVTCAAMVPSVIGRIGVGTRYSTPAMLRRVCEADCVNAHWDKRIGVITGAIPETYIALTLVRTERFMIPCATA